MDESLLISCFADQEPNKIEDGYAELYGEIWRVEDTSESLFCKVRIPLDAYLECYSVVLDDLENEYYITADSFDSWEAAKKIFTGEDSQFAFIFDSNFNLERENVDSMETVKEF